MSRLNFLPKPMGGDGASLKLTKRRHDLLAIQEIDCQSSAGWRITVTLIIMTARRWRRFWDTEAANVEGEPLREHEFHPIRVGPIVVGLQVRDLVASGR